MSEEKVKPFRLVKYFTFTSLIAIFLGTLALSFLNTHWARTMQLEKSEEFARLLVENLNHQVFLQFVVPVALRFGKIRLREKEQFERMDKVVRSTVHSFNVEMVNIYDVDNNIISYSFDPEMVGKRDIGGIEYQNAVQGKSSSRLVYDSDDRSYSWPESVPERFGIFFGGSREIRMITYAPLRAERPLSPISGPVLGVVEIVQDVSEDYKTIFRFQIRVIITCALIMAALFLILRFLVNKGEGIIETRNRERIRLKEELSRAQHLSSLGEMVAGVSHEIRNPLGIIRSSAELLNKKMIRLVPDSEQGTDPSNTIPTIILEEANRLNNIITDFLAYAKPREPNLSLCRIDDILEKNITFLDLQIREQGYVIEIDKDDDIPEIMADPDMIYQAFLNIILNAMQAMPSGGNIQIRIAWDNDKVTVCFRDQGEGIPKSVLEKIWDPFFTTKETGTGLGLGIVSNIIKSHNGNIRVANRPEGGAEVMVELKYEI